MGLFNKIYSGAKQERKAFEAVLEHAQAKGAYKSGRIQGAQAALSSAGLQTSRGALYGAAANTSGMAAVGGALGAMNFMNQDSFESTKTGMMSGALIGAAMSSRKIYKQLGKGSIVKNSSVNQLASGRKGVGDLQRINSFSGMIKDSTGIKLPQRPKHSRPGQNKATKAASQNPTFRERTGWKSATMQMNSKNRYA